MRVIFISENHDLDLPERWKKEGRGEEEITLWSGEGQGWRRKKKTGDGKGGV